MSNAKTFHIASIPGDGIGIEITEAAIQVLDTLSQSSSNAFRFEYDHLDYSSENYSKRGWYMPPDWVERLKKSDAIFFGAVGWPCTFQSLLSVLQKAGERRKKPLPPPQRQSRLVLNVKSGP